MRRSAKVANPGVTPHSIPDDDARKGLEVRPTGRMGRYSGLAVATVRRIDGFGTQLPAHPVTGLNIRKRAATAALYLRKSGSMTGGYHGRKMLQFI